MTPAEIANLLIQIATQIPEIYRLRREALQARLMLAKSHYRR